MQPTSRRSRPRRARLALLAAAAACVLAAAPSPTVPLGIGDTLYPNLGNPGYNVLSYDIGFTYQGDNSKPLEAVTTIEALATQKLDHINLDFTHGTVHSVEVNGEAAEFSAAEEDLVISPGQELSYGEPLRIVVRHTSDPTGGGGGWVRTTDGLVMANQADAAHRVFPCNDHPSDKAYFTFHVAAPPDVAVVANGLSTTRRRSGDQIVSTFATTHPMATELAQVSLGHSAVVRREGPHGLPIRDVVPTQDKELLEPWLKKTPAEIEWMERKVGRYPFETYGVLVAGADTGFELETQTLSLFERSLLTRKDVPEGYVDSIMVHELAHQWFGDSVSPRAWSDVWLNEGHATWYEALYAEEFSGKSLEQRMRDAYAMSDTWRAQGGPPAAPKPAKGQIELFRPVVYDGSALALYALRQEIGNDAFATLERRWVGEHRDSVASTADFSRLASEVAGRDLSGFFQEWLYGEKTPPMPGHPDWRPQAQS
ncbi:M1 family metallopeptidase [Streptomyces melanogenes]|uniref:M1 family metallopeptidase n=1 Tax=Streptomyces melanogenes TaxID=67326 RepID=UPI00167DA58B|nr:M1 family metallopeptidase [Streptomyces melanogenes]GGP86179.1 zinc metalloprotease [Streptomyces melanogenes]